MIDLYTFLYDCKIVYSKQEFKRLLFMSKIKINKEPVIYSKDSVYTVKSGDVVKVGIETRTVY